MAKHVFRFASSLPRSGSTLLCNILAQNPRFHCSHTSGCLDVLFGVRNSWDALVEHKAHPLPVAKANVLKGILNSYYEDIDKPVVLDKSRGWVAYIEMLENILGEKAKIVVCVRQVADILSSIEKLHRATSKIKQPPGEAQNYFQFQSQEGRCEYWLRPDALVGLTLTRINDAINRGFGDRLHFVPYEKLTADPGITLDGIYKFLGEEPFKHDFDHVDQVTHEDDAIHGYINLHTIQNKVQFRPSDAAKVLGARLAFKYSSIDINYNQR